jgi:hypothetical protein
MMPPQSGACSLFIDVIGMPLTPVSYGGARTDDDATGALTPNRRDSREDPLTAGPGSQLARMTHAAGMPFVVLASVSWSRRVSAASPTVQELVGLALEAAPRLNEDDARPSGPKARKKPPAGPVSTRRRLRGWLVGPL